MDFPSDALKAIFGLLATLIGSGLIALVSSYFKRIKEAILAADQSSVERDKSLREDLKESLKTITDRQRKLELSVAKLETSNNQIIRGEARNEGALNMIQNSLKDLIVKVEQTSGRVDAAFRFIDGAGRRSTDLPKDPS